MRALFVNENIGGHATVHAHLRTCLADHAEVEATFLDVPRPSLGRRVAGAQRPRPRPARPRPAAAACAAGPQRLGAAPPHRPRPGVRRAARLHRQRRPAQRPDPRGHAERRHHRRDQRDQRRTASVPGPDPLHAGLRPAGASGSSARCTTLRRWWSPAPSGSRPRCATTTARAGTGCGCCRSASWPPTSGPARRPGPARSGTALPQVVFVGNPLGRKGALRLFDLHQRHLADECELVLVTTDEAPRGRNVRIVDDVTVGSGRLWEVLRAAAVFAFPSPIDQAPNAIIEALAAGLPVVALRQGAIGEMVTPDVGRLVDVDDDAGLVAALRGLLADPSARAGLGAAAALRFARTYDARVSTRALVDLLHEARRRHRSRERTIVTSARTVLPPLTAAARWAGGPSAARWRDRPRLPRRRGRPGGPVGARRDRRPAPTAAAGPAAARLHRRAPRRPGRTAPRGPGARRAGRRHLRRRPGRRRPSRSPGAHGPRRACHPLRGHHRVGDAAAVVAGGGPHDDAR